MYWRLRSFLWYMSGAPRKFYRAYLARYMFFRQTRSAVGTVSRFPQRMLFLMVRPFRERTFNLISMRDFLAGQQNCVVRKIDPGMEIEIRGPRFIGYCPPNNAESVCLKAPEIELFEIPEATVVGGTNFILAKNTVIHPDLFIPSRDLSPAELYGSATINPTIGQIKLYLKRASKKVDRAISLLGQCTGNYAHWITELFQS